MTPTARSGPAPGSPRSPACSTSRAGRPGCDCSSARSARTPARSCGSPTTTGTGSPRSSPTLLAANWPTSSCGTVGGPGPRTASAAPRTAGWPTSRCTTSPRTRSGAPSSPSPGTCSPGCRPSPSTAMRPAGGNPNACACDCSPSPDASRPPADEPGCTSPKPPRSPVSPSTDFADSTPWPPPAEHGDTLPTTPAAPGPVEPGEHPDDTGPSVTPRTQNLRLRRSSTRRPAHAMEPCKIRASRTVRRRVASREPTGSSATTDEQDLSDRPDEDLDVQPERPVLNIIVVVPGPVSDRGV